MNWIANTSFKKLAFKCKFGVLFFLLATSGWTQGAPVSVTNTKAIPVTITGGGSSGPTTIGAPVTVYNFGFDTISSAWSAIAADAIGVVQAINTSGHALASTLYAYCPDFGPGKNEELYCDEGDEHSLCVQVHNFLDGGSNAIMSLSSVYNTGLNNYTYAWAHIGVVSIPDEHWLWVASAPMTLGSTGNFPSFKYIAGQWETGATPATVTYSLNGQISGPYFATGSGNPGGQPIYYPYVISSGVITVPANGATVISVLNAQTTPTPDGHVFPMYSVQLVVTSITGGPATLFLDESN